MPLSHSIRLRARVALVCVAMAVAASTACTSNDDAVPSTSTSQPEITWKKTQNLAPSDVVPGALFGRTIAATPTFAAVGDGIAKAIYVFERQPHEWKQTAKLEPPADGKQTVEFGSYFGAGGQYVFARRRTIEDMSAGHPPRVLVYERSTTGWQLKQQLGGDDVASEQFGVSFANDGTTLVVGTLSDLHSNEAIGSAYVFERTPAAGFVRAQKLEPSATTRTLDSYGMSVTVSGGLIAVSSIAETDRTNPLLTEGALYLYEKSGTAWALTTRLVLAGGDGAPSCIAGGVLVASSNLRSEVLSIRRGPSGFVAEPPLPTSVPRSIVACDGNRFGVVTPVGYPERVVQLRSPAGDGWTTNELPLGPAATGGFAMSNGVLFVGTTDGTGPHVRVQSPGKLDGEACTEDASCVSTFCVDGVCCENACGGGDAADCQACSRAAGSAADGTCGVVPSSQICRPARSECDAPDHCDGSSIQCPADLVAANGVACTGGTCTAGACVADSVPDPAEPGPPPVVAEGGPDEPSGGCTVEPRGRGTAPSLSWWLALAGLALFRRVRRVRPIASHTSTPAR